jgi:large subunit ribosomal protein L33
MSKGKRVQVKLRSTESSYMYFTTKNPRTHPERMELKKFDPLLNRRAVFKESK